MVLLYVYFVAFSRRRNTKCSSIITVITPITKPLPMMGRMMAGTTCMGIYENRSDIISGSPTIRQSSNVSAERDDTAIWSAAASCVPIRYRSMTPMTVLGMADKRAMSEGTNAHTIRPIPAGSRA